MHVEAKIFFHCTSSCADLKVNECRRFAGGGGVITAVYKFLDNP